MAVTTIELKSPDWLCKEIDLLPECMKTVEQRMETIIRFSQMNFEKGTGGPFAAGIFEKNSGKLITIGVNRVSALNCSSAHAEVIALSIAQHVLGTYDLGGRNQPAHQIVVNWRPCSMCYGAVLWSGVRSLVIAGAGPELEDLTGFDEGPVPANWEEELNKRGIEVINDVLKEKACQAFRLFSKSEGFVYNARLG
jgi:tRNA(Arg) A34 adenosine deaminase TadA